MRARLIASLLATLLLAGCDSPLRVSDFAATTPSFDPEAFFAGHTHSWGVLENRSGAPTATLTTDGIGTVEGGDLHMVQQITLSDGHRQTRDWHLHRTGPHRYDATANDMIGVAHGEAAGRVFHWHFTIALQPGNALHNVRFEQWMYLLDDGSMLNRTTVSKLGVIVAEVTEHFTRTDH